MTLSSLDSRLRVLTKRLWHFLIRLDVTALLLFALILFAIAGSCFPQRPSAFDLQPQGSASWAQAIRERYGAWADPLSALGTFELFRSPAFVGLLILLAFITLICTLDRWKAVWRRAFHQEVTCSEAIFEVSPLSFRLSPSAEIDLPKALGDLLREMGYRLRVREQDQSTYLRADRHRLSPAATLITHLGVLLLGLGALLSASLAWREGLTIAPNQPAQLSHNPEITLGYLGYKIERYSDGNVANYAATIQLLPADQKPVDASLRLNEPLHFEGIRFTLQGYLATSDAFALSLMAAYDPGYEPVIAGGFLLLLGLTVSLYFPHCCFHAHITPEGALRLAGRADRRACDFPREFQAIADKLKNAAGGDKKAGDQKPC